MYPPHHAAQPSGDARRLVNLLAMTAAPIALRHRRVTDATKARGPASGTTIFGDAAARAISRKLARMSRRESAQATRTMIQISDAHWRLLGTGPPPQVRTYVPKDIGGLHDRELGKGWHGGPPTSTWRPFGGTVVSASGPTPLEVMPWFTAGRRDPGHLRVTGRRRPRTR